MGRRERERRKFTGSLLSEVDFRRGRKYGRGGVTGAIFAGSLIVGRVSAFFLRPKSKVRGGGRTTHYRPSDKPSKSPGRQGAAGRVS